MWMEASTMYDIRNLNIWKSENTDGPLVGSPSVNISYPGGMANIHTGRALSDLPIDELELSVRAYNCLRRAGCSTVGDVLQYAENSDKGLMRIRNLGAKSAKEIMDKIEEKQGELLQREQHMPVTPNGKKLIRPSGKMLDRDIEEFAISETSLSRLRASGIRVGRDLYSCSTVRDPGWFAVRELFEEMQRLL